MNRSTARLMTEPAFGLVKDLVVSLTGMVFYAERDDSLAGIVERRMASAGIGDAASYWALLQDRSRGPAEREALIAEATIGETYFFRHQGQWEALAELVVPELIRRNAGIRKLRLWSAACAAGAEPYTLAILLQDRFAKELAGWDVSILGTDINRRFLADARAGRYGAWYFRATPDALRETWFTRTGAQWEINPGIRQLVDFQPHNLVSDPLPPGHGEPFDLILCRNVMIYFDQPTIHRLAAGLHGALVEGGWLVVGHAETSVSAFHAFETVMLPGTTLYRKSAQRTAHRPSAPVAKATAKPRRGPARPHPTPRPAAPTAAKAPEPPVAPATLPGLPSDASIREMIARGDWAAAETALDARLRHDALDARAHFLLGLLSEERGDPAAAESAFRRAVFLDRRAALAHYHFGCMLRRKNDRDGAARAFRNVLSLLAPVADPTPVAGADDLAAGALREAAALQLRALETQ